MALSRDSTSRWTRATRSVTPRAGRRAAGPQLQACHQVELPSLPLRRCQEQFLVQPVDIGELEPRRPVGEEAKEEGLEELLDQHLEALVVIGGVGLRHARNPVAASESQEPSTPRRYDFSASTRHATRRVPPAVGAPPSSVIRRRSSQLVGPSIGRIASPASNSRPVARRTQEEICSTSPSTGSGRLPATDRQLGAGGHEPPAVGAEDQGPHEPRLLQTEGRSAGRWPRTRVGPSRRGFPSPAPSRRGETSGVHARPVGQGVRRSDPPSRNRGGARSPRRRPRRMRLPRAKRRAVDLALGLQERDGRDPSRDVPEPHTPPSRHPVRSLRPS